MYKKSLQGSMSRLPTKYSGQKEAAEKPNDNALINTEKDAAFTEDQSQSQFGEFTAGKLKGGRYSFHSPIIAESKSDIKKFQETKPANVKRSAIIYHGRKSPNNQSVNNLRASGDNKSREASKLKHYSFNTNFFSPVSIKTFQFNEAMSHIGNSSIGNYQM